MSIRSQPSGVIVAAVTPFADDESLDEARLAAHLDFLANAGVDGVLVLGGSGEFVNLSAAERKRVISTAARTLSGRIPFYVGALAPSTREVIEVGLHAAREGADALLVLPPYYIRPSFAGVLDHFRAAARETGLPIIAYNNPPRIGFAIDSEGLNEIANLPGIIAVKDCDRDIGSLSTKIARVSDRIAVLSGEDDLAYPAMACGALGGIWTLPNLAPALFVDLCRSCGAGDAARAARLHANIVKLSSALVIANHPGPLKEAMAMSGHSVGPARRPLQGMTSSVAEHARQVLLDLGLLS